MTNHVGKRQLPLLPHPDHLRKQAKTRLAELKGTTPEARLADAQRSLAQEYGFTHWAALQAEVTRRVSGPFARAIHRRRALNAFLVEQDLRGGRLELASELRSSRAGPMPRNLHEPQEYSPVAFLRSGMLVQVGVLISTLVGIGIVCFMLQKAGVLFGANPGHGPPPREVFHKPP